MGVSPIQTKDFWITDEAQSFWNADGFSRIDSELLRLESVNAGYVFDTSTMPWRRQKPALSIWLQSTLDSRVLKSIVSHRGRSQFPPEEYHERIAHKDAATIRLYKDLYDIDIGTDLSCFQLILDISSLISEATLPASLRSISIAHSIIRPAVAAYLTGSKSFRDEFSAAVETHPAIVVRNTVFQGDGEMSRQGEGQWTGSLSRR